MDANLSVVESEILSGANPEQSDVIRHVEGPLLVAAVAGSGKTRALVHRIAWLVRVVGVDPSRILAVTFSKKAGDEMNARLEGLLGRTAARVGTFHSWALEMIRRENPAFREWTIDDRDRYRTLLKEVCGYRNLKWDSADVTELSNYVSFAKAERAAPGTRASLDLALEYFGTEAPLADSAYAKAEGLRVLERLLTFDDMLVVAADLLDDPEVRARWSGRYAFVLQDECQDVNRVQNEIAVALATSHRNYMVVGDPAQTIYAFRGARPEYLLGFEGEWAARVVNMHRNYRCGRKIVEVANRIIRPATRRLPIEITAERETEGSVEFSLDENQDEEAAGLVAEIRKLRVDGAAYRGIAVLCRVNAQSRAPEEAFIGAKIPYVVIGGTNFYERREVRDLLAYLRLAAGRGGADDVKRCLNAPFRYLGKAFVDRVLAERGTVAVGWAERVRHVAHGPGVQWRQVEKADAWADLLDDLADRVAAGDRPSAILSDLVDRTGYIDWLRKEEGEESPENSRASNVRELVRASERFASVAELLDYIAEVVSASRKGALAARSGEVPDRVTITTIHRAKGLEWPAVFAIGWNEGVLPHGRTDDEEEERRLAYVAATRARDYLRVSAVRKAAVGGKSRDLPVSRYAVEAGIVGDLPEQGRLVSDFGAPVTAGVVGAGFERMLDSVGEEHEQTANGGAGGSTRTADPDDMLEEEQDAAEGRWK